LRKYSFTVFVGVVLACSGCAYNGESRGTMASIKGALAPIGATMNPRVYVVQPGDNLSYIAWRYQTSVQSLIVWNNLNDPNALIPGQPLVVRGQQVAPAVPAVARVERVEQPVVRPVIQPAQQVPQQAANTATRSVVIPPSQEQTVVMVAAPVIQEQSASAVQPVAPREQNVVVQNTGYKKPESSPVRPSNGEWVWPVEGRILKPFGGANSSQKGIEISSVPGQAVRAATGGIVAFSGSEVSVLGNAIIIDHSNDMMSAYTNVGELLVTEGENIMAGDIIAYVAGVNGQDASSVHFEIRKQGRPLDPLSKLAKR